MNPVENAKGVTIDSISQRQVGVYESVTLSTATKSHICTHSAVRVIHRGCRREPVSTSSYQTTEATKPQQNRQITVNNFSHVFKEKKKHSKK